MKAIGLSIVLILAHAARAQGVPEIRFDAVDFLKPPADMHLGEVAGVAIGKAGNLYVFQRGNTEGPAYAAAAAQLLEFDRTGRFVREIGHHLYAWSYAHAVRVDPAGNIWAADKGSNMVVKFTPAGRVAMVFGRKPEASDENARPLEHPKPPLPAVDGQFREVTDMAWDSQGNTYISDGYINSRVAKVAPDGREAEGYGHDPRVKRGIRIGSARTGKVRYFIPDTYATPEKSSTSGAEGIWADDKGVIYGAQVQQRAIVRYVKP